MIYIEIVQQEEYLSASNQADKHVEHCDSNSNGCNPLNAFLKLDTKATFVGQAHFVVQSCMKRTSNQSVNFVDKQTLGPP